LICLLSILKVKDSRNQMKTTASTLQSSAVAGLNQIKIGLAIAMLAALKGCIGWAGGGGYEGGWWGGGYSGPAGGGYRGYSSDDFGSFGGGGAFRGGGFHGGGGFGGGGGGRR
jgi:hypothetical protein